MSDRKANSELGSLSNLPALDEMQHWTRSLGQAQQILLEYAAGAMTSQKPIEAAQTATQSALTAAPLMFQPELLAKVQSDFAKESIALWQRFLDADPSNNAAPDGSPAARKDRRHRRNRFLKAIWPF